jgi:biopolymer transport protein ExbB
MKKVFAVLTILGVILLGMTSTVLAQDEYEGTQEATVIETPAAPVAVQAAPQAEEVVGLHKTMKIKFIEGNAGFMSLLSLLLIFGLALCIERIIYLSLASVNTKKLLKKITEALDNGDVEEAKEVCRNTRGPVASILYQGLTRIDEGPEVVEKTVVAYGGVQMGLLEKNVTWISLFISLSPMLAFLGTVVGMIMAFDKIQEVGDISPTVVAGGIKLALITTVFGLIIAMILQTFFNFILTKIEALTAEMEDCSISLLDIIVKYQLRK